MKHFEYFEPRYDGEIVEIGLSNPMYYDLRQYEEMRDEIAAFIRHFRPRKLVVNFSQVRYCPTAVISALLILKTEVENYGGQMNCCGMNAEVRDSFAALKLDGSVFEIHSTAASALGAFSS